MQPAPRRFGVTPIAGGDGRPRHCHIVGGMAIQVAVIDAAVEIVRNGAALNLKLHKYIRKKTHDVQIVGISRRHVHGVDRKRHKSVPAREYIWIRLTNFHEEI